MKKYIFLLTTFSTFNYLIAQTKQSIGKIVYELSSGPNHPIIDMWFSTENYLYQYRQIIDINNLPILKNKRYSNIQDSLADIKKVDLIKEDIKNTPLQNWYGQLKSNEVIYSSFDNFNKVYCIKDTATFVEWQLAQDITTIAEIKCQKALGLFNGMKYTAWFAPSIPVSVAPLQFRGLPGLLIKVINNSNNITLSMLELEWPAKLPKSIQPCSGGPLVSKQEMQELRNTQNANVRQLLETYQKDQKKKQ